MAIVYPYNPGSTQYGTMSSIYTWYVQYYQYPTNTSTIYSYFAYQLNSATIVSGGVQMSITIYNQDAINRQGTTGYTAPTFTYKSLPTITLYNMTLGTSISVYNAEISTTVAASGNGTVTTGSITHSTTLNILVPMTWFDSANSTWRFNVSELVTIVDTAVTQTNVLSTATFIVPPVYNVVVRYENALYTAKAIWVRKDDALFPVQSIAAKIT